MSLKTWVRRIVIGGGVSIAAILVLALIVSGVVWQVAVHQAERDFPPPGRLVEFDGGRSHIHCTGTGSPTILLESGLDDRGSWGWEHLHDDLSQVSRVCAYDRAGMIWSEPREEPRDAERIAHELNALLDAAGERAPFVFVAHSNAGLLVRVYDAQYPDEVAGFVFVDASHPEQDARFPTEIRRQIEERKGEPDRRWLYRILAPYRIFAPERATPRTACWWRSMPDGVMGEARAVAAMSEQAAQSGSLGDRPVVVLSAGVPRPMPGISDEGNAAMWRTWHHLHAELAALSSNSDHRVVEDAGHYIHWDRPDTVVTAIKDVVTAARERGPVASEAGASPKALGSEVKP